MPTRLGRRLWLIVGALLVLIIVLLVVSGRTKTARVNVSEVVRQNLSSMVTTNGKIEPVEPRTFRASFPTVVEKVYVVEGQQVRQGQLLFELDDKAALAELSQARADMASEQESLRIAKAGGPAEQAIKNEADLRKAQAHLAQLRHDNETLTRLVADKAATPEELEQNRLALSEAETEVQSLEQMKQTYGQNAKTDVVRLAQLIDHSQAQIRDDEDKVDSARGMAPFAGTLYSLPIHDGDFVKEGDLLGEMADLHRVRVRAFIDEPELGQIEPNQPVDILWDAHPDRTWSGRTGMVPREVVTHGTRSVGELLCSVTNDRLDLVPNTTVDVHIHVSERPSVLVVPRGAVYIDGSKRFVFRVDDNRLHRRDIKVGLANPTIIEVVSGLQLGDLIALPGDVPLKENLRIKPIRPEE
jgi:HlyD family secretion protein